MTDPFYSVKLPALIASLRDLIMLIHATLVKRIQGKRKANPPPFPLASGFGPAFSSNNEFGLPRYIALSVRLEVLSDHSLNPKPSFEKSDRTASAPEQSPAAVGGIRLPIP